MNYNDTYFNIIQNSITSIPNTDNLRNKSILITGASGLIGSAIVDFLIYLNEKRFYNISIFAAGRSKSTIIERFTDYYSKDYFNFLEYDAGREFAISVSLDYIIHAASNAHPRAYSEEPVETMISNFYGIHNLLKYSIGRTNTRVLFISSSEVYGNKVNNELYGENDYGMVDILNPRSCYPSSKRASETLCASYIEEYNSDIVIARPGHIYGPTVTKSDSRASAQFIRNVMDGKPIIMKSAGAQQRSYCHVFDCATAILTILLFGKCGEAYNISNKESIITIRNFAEVCANTYGKCILFENPDDKERKGYNMMENSALQSHKLEALGWHGIYPIKEGIENTIYILRSLLEQ